MDTYYVTRIEEPDFGCEGIFKRRNNEGRNNNLHGR